MLEIGLESILRQVILYSLPVIISISVIGMVQHRKDNTAAFDVFAWHGSYLPIFIGIFLHRGVLVALPRMHQPSISQSTKHVLTHVVLCITGYVLYQWTIPNGNNYGLPPLHHWWAKVLMFYNLCMIFLHLLPLPNLFMGEVLLHYNPQYATRYRKHGLTILCLVIAFTFIDISLGTWLIYPIYEHMAQPSFLGI